MWRITLAVVACTFWTSAFAARPDQQVSVQDPLAMWLRDAVIYLDPILPNHTFTIFGTELTVSNLMCFELDLGAISSEHQPTAAEASINVNGFGLSCNGSWSFVSPLGHTDHGTVDVVIEDSSIAATVGFGSDGSISIAPCAASLNVKPPVFAGNGTATAIIQLIEKYFSAKIVSLIDSAGAEAVCSVPQQLVNKLIEFISELGLTAPVVMPAETEALALPDDSVEWEEVQLINYLAENGVVLAQTVNHWVQNHIGSGPKAQYTLNLAKLLPKLSTISLPLPWLDLSVGFSNLTAGGLDTMQDLTILSGDPHENHTALSHISMSSPAAALTTSGLNMSHINSSVFVAGNLSLPGVTVSLELNNGTLETAFMVGIGKEYLTNFNVKDVEKHGLGGVARHMIAVMMTQAASTLTPKTFSLTLQDLREKGSVGQESSSELSSSIVDMLNNFLAASLEESAFANIPSNALNLVVELFALPKVNELINTTITSLQEIPEPEAPWQTQQQTLHYYWIEAIVLFFFYMLFVAVYELLKPKSPGKEGQWSSLGSLFPPKTQLLGSMWILFAGVLATWCIMVPVCDVRLKLLTQLTSDSPETYVLDVSLLVYSFPQMIKDFWGSGAYLITMSLLLGSGIMPMLKCIIGIVCWTVPLPVGVRGWLLLIFDLLGRFLFINQAFIAIVVTTLNLTIQLPGIKAEVRAEPVLGILAGTLDLLIGMANWSWLVWLQSQTAHSKNSVEAANKALAAHALAEASSAFQDGQVDSLLSPTEGEDHLVEASPGLFASPPHQPRAEPGNHEDEDTDEDTEVAAQMGGMARAEHRAGHETIPAYCFSTKQREAPKRTCYVALLLLFLTAACYIAGLAQNILEFQLSGLGGQADLYFGSDHSDEVDFTMTGLGFGLPGTNDKMVAAYSIAAAYLILILFGPICTMICWGWLWGAHLMNKGSLRSVRIVRWLCPYLYSWCGMDVLFMSIFAAALEMNLPTQWIIRNQEVAGISLGDVCDEIKTLSRQECIHIDGSLPAGAFFMLGAAIFSFALFWTTLRTFGHPALANQHTKLTLL